MASPANRAEVSGSSHTGVPQAALPPAMVHARGRWPGGRAALEALRAQPVAAHVVAIALALACWALALVDASPGTVSGWGLLGQLPPFYLVGLLILAAGFSLAAWDDSVRPVVLAAYVVALVAMLTATTALLYPEPRYAWVYKHLGVIDYIRVHGSTDRSVDIYNNWPAFFALNAWFSHALGISPLRYANWAQVFFELGNVAAVLFAVRGITSVARTQWTAAWLFVTADWIGQDYLAPQAFAFLLSLVTIGLLLRCAPRRRPPRLAPARMIETIMGRLALFVGRGRIPLPGEAAAPPLGPRAGLTAAGICFAAVVLSHQLSPVFLIVGALVLTATVRRPPLWVIAVMIAVEAWWVWRAYAFISRHFKLFEFDPGASARQSYGGAAHPLAGVSWTANLSRAAIILMVLAAALGAWRLLRLRLWEPSSIALVISPIAVVTFQSYGGEGPLRSYLFALPWLSLLAATMVAPQPQQSRLRRSWGLLALTVAIGACAVPGLLGQETINYFNADDVAATRWYLDHAPSRASVTFFADNVPVQLDANYSKHVSPPAIMAAGAGFPRNLQQVEQFLGCDHAAVRYVLFTPSQQRYVRYYGLLPAGTYGQLVTQMRQSHDFELLYRHGEGYVFLYTAAGAASAPPPAGGCPRSA